MWQDSMYFSLSKCWPPLILLALMPFYQAYAGVDIELAGGLAYRQDQLQWSMAGPNHNPNIISELTWTDLDISLWRLQGRLDWRQFRWQAEFQAGNINNGEVQDSDYSQDDRNGEFSRSNNATDGDNVSDLIGIFAYVVDIPELPQLKLIPRFSFTYNRQNLRISQGRQTLSDASALPPEIEGSPPPLGSFSGLNSTYRALWYGPGVGFDVEYAPLSALRLTAGFDYHLVQYYAWANWNLISQFQHPKSYEQESEGNGYVFKLKGEYVFSKLSVYMFYQNASWQTEGGTTRFFLNLPEGNVVVNQPFNGATWRSYMLSVGVNVPLRF